MMRYPSDMLGHSMATVLLEDHPELNDVGALYIDLWPVADPMIYIFHPGLMSQHTNTLKKAHQMTAEFRPWTGNLDVVTSEGAHWRRWRTLLNPGFSAKNIISMVPDFLDEIRVFKDLLQKHADARATSFVSRSPPSTSASTSSGALPCKSLCAPHLHPH